MWILTDINYLSLKSIILSKDIIVMGSHRRILGLMDVTFI